MLHVSGDVPHLKTFCANQDFFPRLSVHHKHRSVLYYEQKAWLPLYSNSRCRQKEQNTNTFAWHSTKFATQCNNVCNYNKWLSKEGRSLVSSMQPYRQSTEMYTFGHKNIINKVLQEYKDAEIVLEITHV